MKKQLGRKRTATHMDSFYFQLTKFEPKLGLSVPRALAVMAYVISKQRDFVVMAYVVSKPTTYKHILVGQSCLVVPWTEISAIGCTSSEISNTAAF